MSERQSVIIEISLDDYKEGRVVLHHNYLDALKNVCNTNLKNIIKDKRAANYFPIHFLENATPEEISAASKTYRNLLELFLERDAEDRELV